ncbi:MAG: thiamine-phosphate pyrophosphorylase [Helicobacteraceae bacterium]|nr:thiamine-phosphate pyrophosphorylase [Helicobacteraceae bacterium]
MKDARIIDANLNRLREGIRVVEDICRYILNDEILAKKLKELRHISRIPEIYDELLNSRDSENDVLRANSAGENDRSFEIKNVLIANFKRAQEAARVLEEIFKIFEGDLAAISAKESAKYKNIRYEIYTLEKNALSLAAKLPAA